MQSSLKYMLVAVLMLVGSSAWSDCACFCVDGELATMCTVLGEAQDNPDLCPDSASATCPQEPEISASASFSDVISSPIYFPAHLTDTGTL